MAQFTVKPKNAVFVVDDENNIARDLSACERELRSIRDSLGFEITAAYNLRNRLNSAAGRIESHRRCAGGMSSALQDILNKYEGTETIILGNEIVKNPEIPITGNNDTVASEDSGYKKWMKKIEKAVLDVFGKFGYVGEGLALPLSFIKLLIDGDGISAKDVGALLKGTGNSGIGIYKIIKWVNGGKEGGLGKLFGTETDKILKGIDPEAGWWTKVSTAAKETFKDKLGLEKNVQGKYNVKGTTVAGWAFSLVANGFSNYDEYTENLGTDKAISVERAVAETITETVVDIVKGAAIAAGVAAGAAAIGVAAPAVVVGGAAVIVSCLADTVCENITGKSVTEFVSDGILDLAEAAESAKKAVGEAVRSAGKAVSGWFEKMFASSSAQLAGSW